MADFNAGTAGFAGIWDDSLDLMEEWGNEGYLTAGTLSLKAKNAMPCESRMLDVQELYQTINGFLNKNT